jgi:hypothetical protein
MLETRMPTRALPVMNKAVDLAPAAQVCCGVCRTCVTANVFSAAAAAVVACGAYVSRRFRSREN